LVVADPPRKGDWIILNFDPQAGHEQKGRRPALVVSNDLFNRYTGFVMVCPVTRTDRKLPFHVPVPSNVSGIVGFVMVDQVKSIDYRSRKAASVGRAPSGVMDEVLGILDTCLF
jgi:mRNA interferase MazF